MQRSFFLAIFGLSLFWIASAVGDELSERQRSVADRYAQLEQVLLRMSEASATTNPRRALLLKKVLLAGKDKLLALRLDGVVRMLEERRLTESISGQEEIEKDLHELLRLLESENREQRRAAEKEKIKQFLRELEEVIHQEKTLKAKTSQKDKEQLAALEKEQTDIRRRTRSLRDRIEEHENPEASTGKDETSDSKDATPSDSSTPEDGENEKKSEHESDQPVTESPEKNADLKSDASPTVQAMQKALDRMKQAERKLAEAEKNGALEEQEEAIAELQRVKAELEKILRQIREEEMLQTLEKLEARFRRMLRIEQSIRSQTERLAVDAEKEDEALKRQIQIQASRLGADQQALVVDADDALILLREDGTAQAMVESLLQTRFDMADLVDRLGATRLDSVTLDIEDTVIASLREMLEAVELAVKETEKKKENPAPPSGADAPAEDEPLIQLLSELRMIRSMQRRVNERTDRYEKAVDRLKDEPNADLSELRKKVEELARQQNRISRILHDLKTGRIR